MKGEIEARLEQLFSQADDNRGFCVLCIAEAFNVEPNARKYTCESLQRKRRVRCGGVDGASRVPRGKQDVEKAFRKLLREKERETMRDDDARVRADIRYVRHGLTSQSGYVNRSALMLKHPEFYAELGLELVVLEKEFVERVLRLRKQYAALRKGEREARRRGINLSRWESRSYVEKVLDRAEESQ